MRGRGWHGDTRAGRHGESGGGAGVGWGVGGRPTERSSVGFGVSGARGVGWKGAHKCTIDLQHQSGATDARTRVAGALGRHRVGGANKAEERGAARR